MQPLIWGNQFIKQRHISSKNLKQKASTIKFVKYYQPKMHGYNERMTKNKIK